MPSEKRASHVVRSAALPGCLSLMLMLLPAACDRTDPAKQAAPATRPATQPAATPVVGASADDPGAAGGAGGSTPAAVPGSASADPAAPGADASPALVPVTRPANPQPGRPGETYVVQENPELKGRFGKLIVKFPEGSKAEASIKIFKAGEDKPQQNTYNELAANLLPGTYDVEISSVRIPGVEVKPRHDTRIRAGALRITAESGTSVKLFRADGKQAYSGYGNEVVGLPAGKYTVEVAGQREETTVKDNEVTDF